MDFNFTKETIEQKEEEESELRGDNDDDEDDFIDYMDDDMPGRKKNRKRKKYQKKDKLKRQVVKKQFKENYSEEEEEDIFKEDDLKDEYNEKSESDEKAGVKTVSDIWLKMLQNTTSAQDEEKKDKKVKINEKNYQKKKKNIKQQQQQQIPIEEFSGDDDDEEAYENKIKSQMIMKDRKILPLYQQIEAELLSKFEIPECARFLPCVDKTVQSILEPTSEQLNQIKEYQEDEVLQNQLKIFYEDVYKQAFFLYYVLFFISFAFSYRREAYFVSDQEWFKQVIRSVAQQQLGQKKRSSGEDEVFWFTSLIHLAFRLLFESDEELADMQLKIRAKIAFLKV